MCSNKVFEVTESQIASQLSPEEIYDILKNKNGWFAGYYDEVVRICFNRAETEAERMIREAEEERRRAEQDEMHRERVRERELRSQRKIIFKKFKRSGPDYPEYVSLLKRINQGPMMLEDSLRFAELNDLFNSPRSRANFYKLMGWDL